jgi:hypothetical protein
MPTRLFLMLERLQQLDTRLRLAQSQPHRDPLEVARLRARKLSLRQRLSRLMRGNGLQTV